MRRLWPTCIIVLAALAPTSSSAKPKKIEKVIALGRVPWYAHGGLFPRLRDRASDAEVVVARPIGCPRLRVQPMVVHQSVVKKLPPMVMGLKRQTDRRLPNLDLPWMELARALDLLAKDAVVEEIEKKVVGKRDELRTSGILFRVVSPASGELGDRLTYAVIQGQAADCRLKSVNVTWRRFVRKGFWDEIEFHIWAEKLDEPTIELRGGRADRMWDITMMALSSETSIMKAPYAWSVSGAQAVHPRRRD
jgi:hypothetical protein